MQAKNFSKWNYIFLFFSNHLLYKHANMKMWRIQASPKWGKRGVGAFTPLSFYLTFYNAFWCLFLFLNEQGEKGKERRGRVFCLFHSLLAFLLAVAFGLFMTSLKTWALNIELLYVSQKTKYKKNYKLTLKQSKFLQWKRRRENRRRSCETEEKKKAKRGLKQKAKEGRKLSEEGCKLKWRRAAKEAKKEEKRGQRKEKRMSKPNKARKGKPKDG